MLFFVIERIFLKIAKLGFFPAPFQENHFAFAISRIKTPPMIC
jgi:hypothetical protein